MHGICRNFLRNCKIFLYIIDKNHFRTKCFLFVHINDYYASTLVYICNNKVSYYLLLLLVYKCTVEITETRLNAQ